MEKNKLPQGWVEIEFKKIIKSIPLTGKKLKQKEYQNKGKLPVIDQGQNFIGGYTDKSELKIDCNLPVIVFGDHTKIIKFVEQDFVAGADGVKVLESIPPLNPKLVYYFIKAIPLPNKGYARHYQYLNNSTIRIPPLNEQERIVNKIEESLSLFNFTNEILTKTKLQLKQYKFSLLIHALSGKLTTNWRHKHHQKTESNTENNKLPSEWKICKINDICTLVGGGTPTRNKPQYFTGNTVWLTPTEISSDKIATVSKSRESITEEGLKTSSAKIVPKDSVLLTSRATIGRVAIAGKELTTNQGFASFICKPDLLNYYLAYWLWTHKELIIKNAKGTTFKEISKTTLKELEIPLPSLDEQKEIVSIILNGISLIEKNESIIEQLLEQIRVLDTSIFKQAFEGKLVSQNSDDDSAELLLEKILQEKS